MQGELPCRWKSPAASIHEQWVLVDVAHAGKSAADAGVGDCPIAPFERR